MSYLLSAFVLVTLLQLNVAVKPNIIFIIADDLGFSDVGFRNGDIISHNIDRMAREGVILNSSYVQPVCSPSRAAFLTGKYPYKLGIQKPISVDEDQCLDLNEKIFPEELKDLGYATHAVGKWHMGFCKLECTPTNRGFDTFYGIYSGSMDKYDHSKKNTLDFHLDIGTNPADWSHLSSSVNSYSADLYGQRAVDLIENHDTNIPMYMWLAWQNVHLPVDVPAKYSDMYLSNIADPDKRDYYGMITIIDEYIGKMVDALKARDMYENTIIVFTTDNGGLLSAGANNYPLRGGKNTLFEGGTRGVTVVDSPLLTVTGYTHNGLFHAMDWFQTLLHAATSEEQSDPSRDGYDQYDMIFNGGPSDRTEFIYELGSSSAIRVGDWKLILGSAGAKDGYSSEPTPTVSTNRKRRDTEYDNYSASSRVKRAPRTVQLYNLKDDPSETSDESAIETSIVRTLKRKLRAVAGDVVNVPKQSVAAAFTGTFFEPGWC